MCNITNFVIASLIFSAMFDFKYVTYYIIKIACTKQSCDHTFANSIITDGAF